MITIELLTSTVTAVVAAALTLATSYATRDSSAPAVWSS